MQKHEFLARVTRVYKFGNKAGHNPKFFRLPILPTHKKRPLLIEKAKEQVPKLVDNLFHNNGRLFRGERKEAIQALLIYFLNYMCLNSLRISKSSNPCGFEPISRLEIAARCELSLHRTRRAINAMKWLGFLNLTRRWRRDERGDYKGEYSIIQICENLLFVLGFTLKDILKYQKWKHKQQFKQQLREKKANYKPKTINSFQASIAEKRTTINITSNSREALDIKIAAHSEEIAKLKKEKYPNISWFALGNLAKAKGLELLKFLWLDLPELPPPQPP